MEMQKAEKRYKLTSVNTGAEQIVTEATLDFLKKTHRLTSFTVEPIVIKEAKLPKELESLVKAKQIKTKDESHDG